MNNANLTPGPDGRQRRLSARPRTAPAPVPDALLRVWGRRHTLVRRAALQAPPRAMRARPHLAPGRRGYT